VSVEGASMLPTLTHGDFLVAVSMARPRRGSLVVVEHPARPGYEMVKRLAGLPGEQAGGRRLGANEYWMLGDHPGGSTDSRQFGPVPREAIRGVVRLRYWPPSRAGVL
jgi:nickel-type superoxide dismutase maturation protease